LIFRFEKGVPINQKIKDQKIKNSYDAFAAAFFAFTAVALAFAGRLLPNEPLNLLPFAVFLSPLPMVQLFFK